MLLKGKKFTPHAEGSFDAVACDTWDMLNVSTSFGTKDKAVVCWLTSAKMEDGRPCIISKRYNASIHEKSTLAKDLRGWFGKAPTAEFDTEKLLGKRCTLVIQHADGNDGEIYANIIAILKPRAENKLEIPREFVRKKDRTDARTSAPDRQRVPLADKSITAPSDEDWPTEPDGPTEEDDGSSIPF